MQTDMGPLPSRVIVIGTTSAGKTTAGRLVAAILGAPHVELDALWWGPGWREAGADVLRERVAAALAGDRWVVDGNYSVARDLIWPRADAALWLDYSFPRIMARLTKRTARRIVSGEELWNGNTERDRILHVFLPKHSLYVWAARTHWRHRRQWLEAFREPQHARIRLVRARSPRDTERWLDALAHTAKRAAAAAP
jgi:adenylate kinase family enzyme